MYYNLENPLFIGSDLAYMFNDQLQYLELPSGLNFDWVEVELVEGEKVFTLLIPDTYINPEDPSDILTFEQGDFIMLRYNTPIERAIQIGVEEIYFQKKPYNYDTFSEIAEILLIYTDNADDYDTFTTPYSYNMSIPLTPFETEYMGNYRQINFDLNMSDLAQFSQDGYIDFSHLLFSVPNPAYELTIREVAILQESPEGVANVEEIFNRVWQYTESEEFMSSGTPNIDQYQLILEEEPIYFNDAEEGKWVEYLKIYDEDYNYYSAGLQGDEYQLLWDSVTGNFTWNPGFDKFQDYWGMQIELPPIISPDKALYFEYSTNTSWSNSINLGYENIDAGSMQLILNGEFYSGVFSKTGGAYGTYLIPQYEEWYGEIVENIDYDYEFVQFYAETFTIYSNIAEYTHVFDTEYDFEQEFVNLSFYEAVGLYPNYTRVRIIDDDINYNVTFDPVKGNITISDLRPEDGLLDQFLSITAILNFTFGPISSYTQVNLSVQFNQTYLTDIDATFYDYISSSFEYLEKSPTYLFAESYEVITSDSTLFSSISYTRNPHLGNSPQLKGYDDYELYLNFEIFEDQYNVIYEADINLDGEIDFKQEIDIDKDGRIDITRYGLEDPEDATQILWYKIIQDYQGVSKTIDKKQKFLSTEEFHFEEIDYQDVIPFSVSNFRAQRYIKEFSRMDLTQYYRFYSVKFDYDLDGYADSQMEYKREENVAVYDILIEKRTVLGEYEELDVDGPVLANPTLIIFNTQWFSETTSIKETRVFLTEELIYYDIEEGDIVETRRYTDEFIDSPFIYDTEEEIESLSITDINTGQEYQINSELIMFNTTQVGWDSETWGVDNVPVKYDTVSTKPQDGEETFSNIYDDTIIISIAGRYSLFYDFLEDPTTYDPNVPVPVTKFKVKGIFISPQDGVYYTSDKDTWADGEAKTNGHYLYYDSDLNGFYETVFILAPDIDSDGVYDVISIGFNYDGSHDFMPYETLPTTNNKFGASRTIAHSEVTYGANTKWTLNIKDFVDRIYPPDTSDGTAPKDYIFEISKLVDMRDNAPELYYEVKQRQYAKAFHSYEAGFWHDIYNEVFKSTVSGILAALAASWFSGWFAPFVFAITYFTLSYIDSQLAKFRARESEKARTFYDRYDYERKAPEYINDMSAADVDKEGLVAVAEGHPGAYYAKVYGGEPGNMYEASVITSPPKSWRALEYITEEEANQNTLWDLFLNFLGGVGLIIPDKTIDKGPVMDNFNLDYFLITSELPGLAEALNDKYSSGNGFFSIDLNLDDSDRQRLYDTYQKNTIGFLEQEVESRSNGRFDTIRPLVINGVPQYIFVDSNDELISKTQPFSPLYTPIIIRQGNYDFLVARGKYKDPVLTINVDGAYGNWHAGDAFNAYQLHPSEMENYKAKIPLSNKEFHYPITQVFIDVKHPINGVVKSVDVDSSEYTVVDGNLYFYRTLEEIVFTSEAEWWELASFFFIFHLNLDYDVHVSFATVVPYSEVVLSHDVEPGGYQFDSGTPVGVVGPGVVGYQDPNDRPDDSVTIGFHYPTISYTQRYIDTTDSSDNHARTILAQTVSYTISDYVNQAQMAFTDGTNLAERDYTVLVTFWSTLISTLVLLPLTVAKIASMPAYSFKQAVALGLVTIPFGVASEIIEELYLDPYLEKWTQRMVLNLGGDQEAADFFSLLVTSFREAFIGGVSSAIKSRISTGDTDTQIATQQELQVKLDQTSIQTSLKSHLDFDTISGILATIPSFFFGGAGVGIMLYGLDLGSDAIFNALKNRYNRKFSEGRLQLSEFLKAKPALKANEVARFVTKNLISVQTIASPSAAKSQLQVEIASLFEQTSSDLPQITEKLEKVKINQHDMSLMDQSSEMHEEFEERMKDRSLQDTVTFQIPAEVTSYGADDAWDYKGQKLVVAAVGLGHDTKTIKPTMLETFTWVESTMRHRTGDAFEFEEYHVGLFGDQVIAPGVIYLDQDGKVMKMRENSIFPDLLGDIGHELLVDTQGEVVEASYIKYIPISDLTPSQLSQLPIDFINRYYTDRSSQSAKTYKGITGTEEIFTLPTVSDSIKIEFENEFEHLSRQIINELEFGGLKLHDIAYQASLNEFLSRNEKYIIDPATNKEVLDKEWHDYLMVVWKKNYQDKAMTRGVLHDEYIKVINLALRGAVLTNLLKQQVFTVSNEKVLEALVNIIREPDIIHNLLSTGLFQTFIFDCFAQTFLQSNQNKIKDYSSQVRTTNGIVSETYTEFNIMSESLNSIYGQYRDQISEFSIPIFSYTFTEETIYAGPRLSMGSDLDRRYLDTFGIRHFIVKEGSSFKRVGTFASVKHESSRSIEERTSHIIKDAVSAAYVFIRNNIDNGVIQESELYTNLVSLIHESIDFIPGNLITFEKLLDRLIEGWFKTHYDRELGYKGTIKGSKQDIYEIEVIDALNIEIWKRGIALARNDVAAELNRILKDPDFVQSYILNIYSHIGNKHYSSIRRFINDLTKDIDNAYGNIGLISSTGNFEVRKGLVRNVEKHDYFISDYKITIDQLRKLGITKFFDSTGTQVQDSDLHAKEFINSDNELAKQFKILTKEDGNGRALIAVDGENGPVPNGYINGIIVGGIWITNALISYLDGRVLFSEFFDPDFELDPDFMDNLSPKFLVNDQYYRNYQNFIQNEYTDIYTVFSFSEGNTQRDIGAIIHLTDPAFRSESDNLHFKLTRRTPFFKSSQVVRKRSKKTSDLWQANPFLNKVPIEVYGKEFTKDVFMEIYYSLFDIAGQGGQRTQTLAMKFLSYLNGVSFGTNFEEFRQGPSISDLNIAIKKLGFTEEELQKFIWKKIDSKTGELIFNYEQTKKEWLKLLYDKITEYTPNDGSVYAQQRDTLKGLVKGYAIIDDSSIARNREGFTIEEAKMGVEIFKAAQVIFGHFTIRLTFANMIDYYGDVGSFGIKVASRPPLEASGSQRSLPIEQRYTLKDFLYKIGLIPSTRTPDRPFIAFGGTKLKSHRTLVTEALFGAFFLESHVYLEIENVANVKSPDNTLSFSLGPLVAITPLGGFSGENLRTLSKSIGIYLATSYELYHADNFNPLDTRILGKNYLNDQSRTFDFIAKKIRSTIIGNNYYREREKNIWLANQLIEAARLGLISGTKSVSGAAGYLRVQIEDFMNTFEESSGRYSLILEFNYLMPKLKKPFRLEITQDELIDNTFTSWGSPRRLKTSDFSSFRAQLLHQNSHNIRKYLKSIINIFGTNERVRIFPLLDSGDPDLGYQFFTDSQDHKWSILPERENYFDIDLNKEEDMYKLQHIINLLYTGEFAFVVKRSDGAWNDGEMIFALNRDGFLEPNEIYSSNIDINEYSTSFRGDSNDWRKSWIYPMAWGTSDSFGNTDIRSYLNYINDPTLNSKYINGFIREYMERMEILFPGYRAFIEQYLKS